MDAFQDLLTQPSQPQVSPELLEMLGNQAATLFTQKGVALNDGVSQILAQHPELGNEHIRRVIEFANNAAFQELFEKGQDKNVHFPVADPGVIIRDLKDGGSPAHDGRTLDEGKKDYQAAPTGKNEDMGDAELNQLFAGKPSQAPTPIAKTASVDEVEFPHTQHANPIDDVFDVHTRLRATRSELAANNDAAESGMKLAQEDLYRVIKSEVIGHGGAGLGGVLAALEKIGGRTKVGQVLPGMIQKLIDDGVSPDVLDRSLMKTAGVVVNPQHPLVLAWHDMVKAAEQRVLMETALHDVDQALGDSNKFLRSRAQ